MKEREIRCKLQNGKKTNSKKKVKVKIHKNGKKREGSGR